MKRLVRAHDAGTPPPPARDSKLARWLERARLGSRWDAASAEAVDSVHEQGEGPSELKRDAAAQRRTGRGH